MDDEIKFDVSVIVLAYNRPDDIKRNVEELVSLRFPFLEIIVVDNNSDIPVRDIIDEGEGVSILRLAENRGVGGRNEGIKAAQGSYVITLDDDVFGLTGAAVERVVKIFDEEPKVGAINFRVLDDLTENQINWCHHRKIEDWGHRRFLTYEISEGAVAFRRETLECSGLYPEFFFISHEGPDLALRIMNCDYEVIYHPAINVRHAHSEQGRPSWRRYYYDTRNTLWLAWRCYSLRVATRKVPIALGVLFIYSIRDGYCKYWFKAIRDAIKLYKCVISTRVDISNAAWDRYREIERFNPSAVYMIKVRFFQRNIGI